MTKKWREGVTVGVDFAINGEGGRAEHVVAQKLGRGLIPKEHGRPLQWHDIWDSGHSTLHKQSTARRKALEYQGWPVVRYSTLEAFKKAKHDAVRDCMMDLQEALRNGSSQKELFETG